MSGMKSFWGKFFPRNDDHDIHDPDSNERKDLHDTLRDEYGISVTQESISLTDIQEKGYRRVSADEFTRFSTVFQYIPQIASAHVMEGSVQAAFDAATKGTYLVSLKAGAHLGFSHETLGAFRGLGFDDVTNKMVGHAELFKNDAILSVSKAPQIALGLFNIASLITGQYFMSQVNGKLSELKGGVGRIEHFLDANQRSELKAAFQELEDIIARIDFIKADEKNVFSTIDQIHSIQRTAQKSINLRRELITNEIASASKTDKDNEISRKLDSIGKYLVEYRYAAQLYCVATLLEVQLRDISDIDELSKYQTQMNSRVEQYINDYNKCKHDLEEYLNKNHVLNDRSLLQNLTTGSTLFASLALGFASGIFKGIELTSKVDALFNDYQKKKKTERVGSVKNYMDDLSDMSSLLSPVKAVTNYISSVGEEINILKVGDEYYTNIPTAES